MHTFTEHPIPCYKLFTMKYFVYTTNIMKAHKYENHPAKSLHMYVPRLPPKANTQHFSSCRVLESRRNESGERFSCGPGEALVRRISSGYMCDPLSEYDKGDVIP